MTDEDYMRRALELAMRGLGWVNPNPLVGAVVVRDGRIIGEGWHQAFGGPHAERQALADCRRRGENPQGSSVYVTLEPCCHTGKTPPCTEALIEAGVSRVVMGAQDPNPRVSGGGVAQLEEAGIEVVRGVLEDECEEANKPFFHYIKTGKPYVTLKYAMTLDGKIATRSGKSKWITGPEARRHVHEGRQRNAAIMVGVNTVIKDDPLLTCRLGKFEEKFQDFGSSSEKDFEDQLERELAEDESAYERVSQGDPEEQEAERSFKLKPSNPIRIVCDAHLRTPLDSQVVKTAAAVPTYIATAESDLNKHMPYCEQECDIIVVPEAAGHIDLEVLMEKIGAMGIDSVIVEGGSEINWSVLAYDAVQKVQAYIAPKIFGGAKAPSPVAGFGVEAPKYAIGLSDLKVVPLGSDVLIECEVR